MLIGKEKLEYGGIFLQNGIYVVVEVANYVTDYEETTASDLFTPLHLDVKGFD